MIHVDFLVAKFNKYPGRELTRAFPRLVSLRHAADLAARLLQLVPERRLTAAEALRHPYFTDLPEAVHLLRHGTYLRTYKYILRAHMIIRSARH